MSDGLHWLTEPTVVGKNVSRGSNSSMIKVGIATVTSSIGFWCSALKPWDLDLTNKTTKTRFWQGGVCLTVKCFGWQLIGHKPLCNEHTKVNPPFLKHSTCAIAIWWPSDKIGLLFVIWKLGPSFAQFIASVSVTCVLFSSTFQKKIYFYFFKAYSLC